MRTIADEAVGSGQTSLRAQKSHSLNEVLSPLMPG